MKFLKIESFKKGILLSAVFNIPAKGLVFLINLLVVYYFGAGRQTDVYFYVYATVLLIAGFFTMLNSTVVIPEAMRIRTEEGEVQSKSFLNFFILFYLTVTVIISLGFLIDPVDSFLVLSKFDSSTLQEQKILLYLAMPLIPLATVTNLITDVLISYRYFTAPMIVSIVNGLTSFFFLIAFHTIIGIEGLLIAFLLSYGFNLIILIVLMRRWMHWNFFHVPILRTARIWRNVVYAQAGNITTIICNYAPFYLLSGFNSGVITALSLAQQVIALPNALVTNHFSTVASIKFNELYARKDYTALNTSFISTAKFLLFLLTAISGVFFLFPNDIIAIIFKRGAYNHSTSSVDEAGLFLKYLGLMLPLQVINTLIARLFMAAHKIGEAFWYQIIFNFVLISMMYFTVTSFGIVWYPLTLVTVYFLNAFVSYYLEKHFFNIINYKQILTHFFVVIFLNVLIVFAVMVLMQYVLITDSSLLKLATGGAVYAVLVLGINYALDISDTLNFYIRESVKKLTTYL